MLEVSAIMERDVVTVFPSETVAEAVHLMATRRCGAVVVLEEGRLRGIFTERDLLERVIERGFPVQETELRGVMTPNPVTVFQTASIREGAQLVREHRFRHLPVINPDGTLVGILSARRFLQFVLRGLERHLEQERHGEPMGDPYDRIGHELSE